jgi:hypothetical protein
MPDKMAVGLGGSKVEPATVEMDDRLVRPPIRRMCPNSRYAAEGGCFECHVVARQNALHESIELSACFDSAWHALGGAGHGAHGGGDRSIFGIDRMYYDKVRRCAVWGRSMHSRFLIKLEWESVLCHAW